MKLNHFLFSDNLSIDNALSTVQIIHQLITKVNDVIDTVNNEQLDVNTYTDEQIKKLDSKLSQSIKDTAQRLSNDIDSLADTLKLYTDSAVGELRGYVIDEDRKLLSYIDVNLGQLKSDLDKLRMDLTEYVDSKESALIVYIDEVRAYLEELYMRGSQHIYSPVDGMLKSVLDVSRDITNVLQQKNGINWDRIVELMADTYTLQQNLHWQLVKTSDIEWIYLSPNTLMRDIVVDDSTIKFKLDVDLVNAITIGQITNQLTKEVTINLSALSSNIVTKITATCYKDSRVFTVDFYMVDFKNATQAYVTYDSWLTKLNTLSNFKNWNALAFYTTFCLNESLVRASNVNVNVQPTPEMMSLSTDYYKERR